MSDVAVEIKTLTGTAYYSKKLNDGNYGSDEAGIHVQFDIDPEWSDELILSAARDAFVKAKATVYEQLGIKFSVTDEGVVAEALDASPAALAVVKEVFPGATVESVPEAAAPADGPWYGKRGRSPSDKATGQPILINGQDPWDVLATNPDLFYDNRPRKASGEYKPTSPDFKHKDSGTGLWQS